MGEWWRLITVAFLHGHPLHLFFNGFALFHLSRVIASLAPVRLLLPLFLLSLVVAIPTMIAFSYFRNKIDSIIAEAGKRVEQVLMPLGRRKV